MRRPSGPAIAVIVLVGAMMVAALYVLSIGPAWRLRHSGKMKRDTFYAIYLPL